MNRKTKQIIYKCIYYFERFLEIPFIVILMIAMFWYSKIWEPLDDILLSWVESNNEKEK